MNARQLVGAVIVVGALAAAAWVVLFHSEWLKPVSHEEAEEKVDTEVAVRVAKMTRATLRKTIELGCPEARRTGVVEVVVPGEFGQHLPERPIGIAVDLHVDVTGPHPVAVIEALRDELQCIGSKLQPAIEQQDPLA